MSIRIRPHDNKILQLYNLVNGDTVHVGIINKPDDLVGEQFPIVL